MSGGLPDAVTRNETTIAALDHDGFAIVPKLLAAERIAALLQALEAVHLAPLRGGIRHIDPLVPAIAELAAAGPVFDMADACMASTPRLVRAIYFEKSPDNNWLVSWHQDRTVAVPERFDAPGWGQWSRKDDAWHVQPPLAVLESMITLRIHLDPATVDNGCLKLIPGSHKLGLLATAAVAGQVAASTGSYCEVRAGDAVVMRPHVLHASEKARLPLPRRVLHFEYSDQTFP